MAAGCRDGREPFVTYYNGQFGLSVRHPATWRTEQAEQEGVWYRYFLGPPAGPKSEPAVSATLLVGKLNGTLDEYAQVYLAGNTLASARNEERQGARGRSYLFSSADRATRYSLLLVEEEGRVFGLFTQGETPFFERHYAVIEEMAKSLTLERAASYPVQKNDDFGFSIRLPPTWRESRRFSGSGTLLLQFTSPALAADKDRQTVHAALTLTVEPLAKDATLDSFYEKARQKQGESFLVFNHGPWRTERGDAGYVDVMRTETPISISDVKRFYRVEGGRGYSLAFETRDDVYPRVARWYDVIASSFATGPERDKP